jgi:hypothetical protein
MIKRSAAALHSGAEQVVAARDQLHASLKARGTAAAHSLVKRSTDTPATAGPVPSSQASTAGSSQATTDATATAGPAPTAAPSTVGPAPTTDAPSTIGSTYDDNTFTLPVDTIAISEPAQEGEISGVSTAFAAAFIGM